ncbi:Radical S-adenosyl methionine domain-containing protein 2 [Rhizophlyctis rosea]|nr:Radical S-adenosyl methionine domain-containing protein 2 [Rhizophlyctis rosea]
MIALILLAILLPAYIVKTILARTKKVPSQSLVVIKGPHPQAPTPISVNYHFTRKCNYNCGFCFFTQKSSTKLALHQAKHGLTLLRDAGMRKLNFAGGEPFLYPEHLGQLCRFCKVNLNLESVSIITNASLIKEAWLDKYGQYIDIIGVSCDSFDDDTNRKIGRTTRSTGHTHTPQIFAVATWCHARKIKFKLNTVVNAYNYSEDMNAAIRTLNPHRWKVFQVLILAGENGGGEDLRDAREFVITDGQFRGFLERHQEQSCMVPEDNKTMKDSYLILDEEMRFLYSDATGGGKVASKSILEVGVEQALKNAVFDRNAFLERGGEYDWTKQTEEAVGKKCEDGCGSNKALDW